MMNKVLIANRGEIALRIQRACAALHISYAQCASEADRHSLAVRKASEIAFLNGNRAEESYLNVSALLEAAKHHGCDSVHPGYGFLSENPEFAQRVIDEGLTWIGPSPSSIRALGTKTNARALVTKFNVPTTPGTEALDNEELLRASKDVGFPIIIKAAAGGGGRGMRIVHDEGELRAALPNARAEALKNFANEAIYLERFIENPRHVEVQILGDTHGNIVHLGTRDCSTQRRHQKLIEEAPAPNLSETVRNGLHNAAVNAARSAGYYSAGTAEFLVKGEEFFFLEMNTRIQVEHPVTEEITGIDLVQQQLKVAMGEPLPFSQKDITFSGHSIELRINAETVTEKFRPAIGEITFLKQFSAPWLREERGYDSGDEISPYYDSLISKLIINGSSREEAIFRAFQVATSYEVHGIDTALPFHIWMLATKEFQEGGFDIGFVERNFTAQCLEDLPKLIHADADHHEKFKDASKVERVVTKTGLFIDLVHEDGGTFLAVPLKEDGTRSDQSLWKRSNSRSAVIRAIME